MVQLAVAWCLKNKNVSTCMLGGKKVSQLEENFKALNVARKCLTKEIMAEIDKVLGNKPSQDVMLWRSYRALKQSL